MDRYDELKAELRKKEWEWEDSEQAQRQANKKLQERYADVEDKSRRIHLMLEDKYQVALAELRKSDCEIGDLHQTLNDGLSNCFSQIDHERRQAFHRLDQEQEELDAYYRRQNQKFQDEIDEIYRKYRE